MQIIRTINIKSTDVKALLHTLLLSGGGNSIEYWPKHRLSSATDLSFASRLSLLVAA